jgi:uncharacterized membrane protein
MLKILRYAPLLLIAFAFAIAFYIYPKLPEALPSHWNAQGDVDATTSKVWILFLLPAAMSALWGIFLLIPRVDPLRANIAEFRPYYDGFVVLILFFMIFLHLQLILRSQGTKIDLMKLMPFGMGLVFYYGGILCTHAKRNWFIGVRTPWTLTSDRVWAKTNKLGGMLFKITGIITFFGVMYPNAAFYLLLIPALITGVVVVVYSYIEFKKEVAEKSEQP